MKKLFFLALLALCMPMSTWADEHQEDPDGDNSGQLENGDVWDDEQEENLGSIVPTSVQLEYKILSAPQGTAGEEGYVNGTVELEGIYGILGDATSVGALYIPHEIQVVTVENLVATVSLYDVVGIGENAFRVGTNYSEYNSGVTSVSIPYTVEYVGDYAFYSNTGITSIVFATDATGNTNVTKIGAHAFHSCTFTAITIPASVETIDDYAISWNSSLTQVLITDTDTTPSQLTTIGDNAFYGDSKLTSIELPESLTSMGEYALGSTGLVSVVLPMSLVELPQYLFGYCSSLTDVTMNGVVTLSNGVFYNCSSLKAIILLGDPGDTGGTEGRNDYGGGDSGITVYVPLGSAATYLASPWGDDVETETALSWNFFDVAVSSNGYNEEDGVYYATYYLDEDGYVLDGTAYTVSSVTANNQYGGEVSLNPVSGIIPANTALLLEASAAGSLYFYDEYDKSESSTATVDSNMLYGSNEDNAMTALTDGDYYYYKLSYNEGDDAGFYWGAEEGGVFDIAAYKAWLAVPQSVFTTTTNRLYIKKPTLDEGTTGITAVDATAKAAVEGIYTLQGVRVNNMNQKGVYIVNGKKVIVK